MYMQLAASFNLYNICIYTWVHLFTVNVFDIEGLDIGWRSSVQQDRMLYNVLLSGTVET